MWLLGKSEEGRGGMGSMGSPPHCRWKSAACGLSRRSGPAAGGRTSPRPAARSAPAAATAWCAAAAPPGAPSPAPGGLTGGWGLLRPHPQAQAPPSSLAPHQLGLFFLLLQLQSQLLHLGLQELFLTVRAPGRRGELSQPRGGGGGWRRGPRAYSAAGPGGSERSGLSAPTDMSKVRVWARLQCTNFYRARVGG